MPKTKSQMMPEACFLLTMSLTTPLAWSTCFWSRCLGIEIVDMARSTSLTYGVSLSGLPVPEAPIVRAFTRTPSGVRARVPTE
jgi:hypothetical protein